MPFGRSASLFAKGEGDYLNRVLVLQNVGELPAVQISITFDGEDAADRLLALIPLRLAPGETVRLPLRRVRRDAVFRLTVTWVSEGGEPGRFYGVVTAGE